MSRATPDGGVAATAIRGSFACYWQSTGAGAASVRALTAGEKAPLSPRDKGGSPLGSPVAWREAPVSSIAAFATFVLGDGAAALTSAPIPQALSVQGASPTPPIEPDRTAPELCRIPQCYGTRCRR